MNPIWNMDCLMCKLHIQYIMKPEHFRDPRTLITWNATPCYYCSASCLANFKIFTFSFLNTIWNIDFLKSKLHIQYIMKPEHFRDITTRNPSNPTICNYWSATSLQSSRYLPSRYEPNLKHKLSQVQTPHPAVMTQTRTLQRYNYVKSLKPNHLQLLLSNALQISTYFPSR